MFMKDKRRSKLLSIKDLTQEFYKKEKIKKGFNDISIYETQLTYTSLDKESFEQACKYSHGAIIGTKFIKEISNGNLRESIKDFIASIRS